MEDDRQPGIITDAVVREAVSIAGTVMLLWLISGSGRTCIATVTARIRARFRARGNRIDAEVAILRRDISRWEHEQAAQAHRRPGTGARDRAE